jgi:hypothetical protein
MFGPHDSLSTTRGVRFAGIRVVVLLAPAFAALAVAPMLLMLLPLAFAGLPFLLVTFLGGASRHRFETRRIQAWNAAAQHA